MAFLNPGDELPAVALSLGGGDHAMGLIYASGPIGSLVPEEVRGLVRYLGEK